MRSKIAFSLALTFCVAFLQADAYAEKGAQIKPVLAKPGQVLLEDNFAEQKLGQSWVVNKGTWSVQDGALVGREKKEDKHAAVLTLQKPHRSSIIRFSFQLDGASAFHLSFNHAKGHLFRVAVSPSEVTITKDKDKKDAKSKALVLGKAAGKFAPKQWHTMLVESHGDQVAVQIDNGVKLDGHDPSLDVEKTGYRFVVRGETLLLDDVHVWKTEM